MSVRAKGRKVGKHSTEGVGIVKDDRTKIVYVASDSLRYEITVREMDALEELPPLMAVGF